MYIYLLYIIISIISSEKTFIFKYGGEKYMLYVTGDTHGDFERFFQPELKKLKKGDTLFVCGDFGFIWDDSETEQKMLKKLGSQ